MDFKQDSDIVVFRYLLNGSAVSLLPISLLQGISKRNQNSVKYLNLSYTGLACEYNYERI